MHSACAKWHIINFGLHLGKLKASSKRKKTQVSGWSQIPGGSCSPSTPSELGNTFTFKIRHSTERTGSWYNGFMQLHLRMLIFLQNRIIQQSRKWHGPTGLGLHIKWLGNVNPGLQKLSLTRVLRLHSTLQDQASIWLALVLTHSMASHPNKWEQLSKGSSNSSKE